MGDVYPSDLVAWMRLQGVSEAEVRPDGSLSRIVLGPAPAATDDQPTQPKPSPLEQARREREQRRAMALRASGGPVKALGEID